METYCSVEDIERETAGIEFNADTEVTSDDLEKMIEQESHTINGCIRKRYIVPVVEDASPEAYSILNAICIQMVLRRVLPIVSRLDSKNKDNANTAFDPSKRLMQIRDGKILLGDAPNADQQKVTGYGIRSDFQPSPFRDYGDGENW